MGYPPRMLDLGSLTPWRERRTSTGFPLGSPSGSGALGKRREQLKHPQSCSRLTLLARLQPPLPVLSSSRRRRSPFCVENSFLQPSLVVPVSIDFHLAVLLSACRTLEFLRSAGMKAALLHPQRRPITAQPRGTRAEWAMAGLCADGWASRRR